VRRHEGRSYENPDDDVALLDAIDPFAEAGDDDGPF
jgi:hypothetical protein